MIRIVALLFSFTMLMACADQSLDGPPADLGDFKLGHNVVVATNVQQGPVSRAATSEEWVATMTSAIDKRFGRYEGEQLYHLGISVEAFMLAPPGVPLVYTPRSVLIIKVTLWDDGDGRKLNEAPHTIAVLEDVESKSVIVGSGWSRDKQEQLDGLAFNAVETIEAWMLEQRENYGWFTEDERVAPAESETAPKVLGERT